MQAEPLIRWSEPVRQLVGFAAQFLAAGAVGFRYAALRHRLRPPRDTAKADLDFEPERLVHAGAAQRAAVLGAIGALVTLYFFMTGLPRAAARAHVAVDYLLTHDAQTIATFVLLLTALVGFGVAAARRLAGWPIALAGVILAPLTPIVSGQWARLVNPVHELVAGLWIGTLYVLVHAGIAAVLRDERAQARRGLLVAELVNGFSPLALVCGMLLVLSGVVTAWRHLNPLSSLWTTPYGWTLVVKLVFVAGVFALGAWNWRRQRPNLGSVDAAQAIQRSARNELVLAGIVLVVTSVLVSLPSPRPPKPPAASAPGVTAAARPR